ncbi:MAG: hypothetical protein KVP17_003165 [Porospora cf. gigantea B]|uniref:uncharacterized protein n=1 Tax=Porospora cf. gigantea B TaxID=2853592 RepID=UPI003571C3E6|nr:MAG: hypothetical protein KVP17_003165 [Porospora cf. gigantea B]
MAGYHHMVADYFRATEPHLCREGLDELFGHVMHSEGMLGKLDVWARRPNGSLMVGLQNKTFFKRLIGGADLKNQAGSSTTAAVGFVQYLNLPQLLQIRAVSVGYTDWRKTPSDTVRNFGGKVEECIGIRLIQWLTTRTLAHSEAQKMDVGFHITEKKFIGRKLILHLGALAFLRKTNHPFQFEPVDSQWFMFLVNDAVDSEETRGVYFQYPSLAAVTERPENSVIYCLAEHENMSKAVGMAELASDWHVLKAEAHESSETLVEVARSFKNSSLKAAILSKGEEVLGMQSPTTAGPDTDRDEADASEEAGFWGDDGYYYCWDEETQQYYCYEGEDTVGEGDEEVPEGGYTLYWDPYKETYIYYEHPVYFDPECDLFYIYNEEEDLYYYMDDECQAALTSGDVPTWDYDPSDWEVPEGYYLGEDGYYYPLESYEASEHVEEAEEAEMAPEQAEELEVTTAEPVVEDPMVPEEAKEQPEEEVKEQPAEEAKEQPEEEAKEKPEEKPKEKPEEEAKEKPEEEAKEKPEEEAKEKPEEKVEETASTPTTEVGDVPTVIADDDKAIPVLKKEEAPNKLSQPSPKNKKLGRLPKGVVEQFKASEGLLIAGGIPKISIEFDDQPELLSVWEKRANGSYRVGDAKKMFDGLIRGTMELKALSNLHLANIASSLNSLNLAQLVRIRSRAKNSAWDRSPQSGMKMFALKTDTLIAENLVLHMLAKAFHDGVSLDPSPYLQNLRPMELRYMGSQAIFVLGGVENLKVVQDVTNVWWFIPATPAGGCLAPRGKADDKPRGIFVQASSLHGQFDRPEGVDRVYRLGSGRANAGFMLWDVIEINLTT